MHRLGGDCCPNGHNFKAKLHGFGFVNGQGLQKREKMAEELQGIEIEG
jgi:hypothetical protein